MNGHDRRASVAPRYASSAQEHYELKGLKVLEFLGIEGVCWAWCRSLCSSLWNDAMVTVDALSITWHRVQDHGPAETQVFRDVVCVFSFRFFRVFSPGGGPWGQKQRL